MFKKILVPLIFALVAALAIGGVAYAASQPEKTPVPVRVTHASLLQGPIAADKDAAADPGRRRGLGQITALGDGQFTVQLKSGEEKVIRVGENTRYFKGDGSAGSFTDLQVGLWVIGRVAPSAEGPLARVVILMPAGFDPNLKLIRHAGEITTVDPAAGAFGLKTRQGENLTFQTDGSTQYFGQVESLADLQPGMLAVVAAKQLEDGSYLAVRVTAHEKPQVDVKKAGRVTAMDASSFTIRARDGNTYTFQVTPETRFRSRGVQVKGLKDLRLGMGVAVAAQEMDEGQLKALVVIVKVK
jgi:hypothetical protein